MHIILKQVQSTDGGEGASLQVIKLPKNNSQAICIEKALSSQYNSDTLHDDTCAWKEAH